MGRRRQAESSEPSSERSAALSTKDEDEDVVDPTGSVPMSLPGELLALSPPASLPVRPWLLRRENPPTNQGLEAFS